nr:CASP-like protein 4D1 [Ipomoea batatas]
MSQFDMYAYDEGRQHQQQEPRKKSKMALLLLVSRVVTSVALLVSIALTLTTKKTYQGYRIRYDDYQSYRYTFYVMIIGFVYNLLQIPLDIYFFFRGELLIRYSRFVKFQFYADKVMVVLLAAAVGATFGATSDLDKHVINESEWEHRLHDYWSLMYLPAIILLVGFVTSVISAVISSETTLAKSQHS